MSQPACSSLFTVIRSHGLVVPPEEYLRRHTVEHAADSGDLDQVIHHPDVLTWTDPDHLIPLLGTPARSRRPGDRPHLPHHRPHPASAGPSTRHLRSATSRPTGRPQRTRRRARRRRTHSDGVTALGDTTPRQRSPPHRHTRRSITQSPSPRCPTAPRSSSPAATTGPCGCGGWPTAPRSGSRCAATTTG